MSERYAWWLGHCRGNSPIISTLRSQAHQWSYCWHIGEVWSHYVANDCVTIIAGTCLLVVLAPFFFLATNANEVLLFAARRCLQRRYIINHGALLLAQRPPLHKEKNLHLRAQKLATPGAYVPFLKKCVEHWVTISPLHSDRKEAALKHGTY